MTKEDMYYYIQKLPNDLTEEEINQEYARFIASRYSKSESQKMIESNLQKDDTDYYINFFSEIIEPVGVNMNKYRSGGLFTPDNTRLGSYVYEPVNEVNESIVDKLCNIHCNIPLNHAFLKSLHPRCFPISIEKRIKDCAYSIVICSDYYVALHLQGLRHLFSNFDFITIDKLDEAVYLIVTGKLKNNYWEIKKFCKDGYVEPVKQPKFTEQQINQAYKEVKEQVMDKEYMDVLEYCKKFHSKIEWWDYILKPRNPLKKPLRVCFTKNQDWSVSDHNFTTLKEIIDYLDSWF